ncbi:MFS transporter [Halomonas cupida]|uniref:MFS transporter n=1 Tax=Halomonas cupida TaxID=44933 RepID=UPI0039B5BACE
MTTLQCNMAAEQSRRERATRLVFLLAGIAMASWAPLVPYVKNRLAIDAGSLGVLLLCLGIGSLMAMPVTGALVARHGARPVIVCSSLVALACLPLLAGLSWLPVAFVVLLVFGGAIGMLDVAMNLQAVVVERESGRTIMSGFHGMFSLGSLAGVGIMMALLAWGTSPVMATLVVVALSLVALVVAWEGLLVGGAPPAEGPLFAVPRGVVLLLGVVCGVSFLVEGAMLDWVAVLLHEYRQVDTAYAGLGYALFSVTMTVGRLTGDRITTRFGHVAVATLGPILAALGMLLICLIPHWSGVAMGCILVGVGCANLVPVMFSLAGRQTLMPERIALPAVATMGYAGILAGPAAIGFVADVTSLVSALFMLVGLLMLASLIAASIQRSSFLSLPGNHG